METAADLIHLIKIKKAGALALTRLSNKTAHAVFFLSFRCVCEECFLEWFFYSAQAHTTLSFPAVTTLVISTNNSFFSVKIRYRYHFISECDVIRLLFLLCPLCVAFFFVVTQPLTALVFMTSDRLPNWFVLVNMCLTTDTPFLHWWLYNNIPVETWASSWEWIIIVGRGHKERETDIVDGRKGEERVRAIGQKIKLRGLWAGQQWGNAVCAFL